MVVARHYMCIAHTCIGAIGGAGAESSPVAPRLTPWRYEREGTAPSLGREIAVNHGGSRPIRLFDVRGMGPARALAGLSLLVLAGADGGGCAPQPDVIATDDDNGGHVQVRSGQLFDIVLADDYDQTGCQWRK